MRWHRCSRRWTGWRSGSRTRAICASDTLTEADIRLFTTLVRFDAVYHGHFKCNIRRLVDYRHLWAYTRDIFQIPGIAATVNLGHIKRHYYLSQKRINPTGIVPAGPLLDFDEPRNAARMWRVCSPSEQGTRLEIRNLGASGLRVSSIGLGCNNFGGRIDLDATRR